MPKRVLATHSTCATKANGYADLVEVGFLGLLQLLLKEKDDFLDVSTGSHTEHDTNGLTADFHVGAEGNDEFISLNVTVVSHVP